MAPTPPPPNRPPQARRARRIMDADPLVRKKKPAPKPAPKPAAQPSTSAVPPPWEGVPVDYSLTAPLPTRTTVASLPNATDRIVMPEPEFDPDCTGPYTEYPVYLDTTARRQGVKYHVMSFRPAPSAAEQIIDPWDEKQFMRPLRLQRRDPRDEPRSSLAAAAADDNEEPAPEPADDKEKERLAALKAEKQAQREAALAQIAPTEKSSPNKKKAPQKKTEQIFRPGGTEERQKNWNKRYEEAHPWFLESFDEKQVWRGHYEAEMSGNHVLFTPKEDENGKKYFTITLLDNYYRFTREPPKSKITNSEEVEAQYNALVKPAKFEQHFRMKREAAEREAKSAGAATNRLRKGERGEKLAEGANERNDEAADIDDIDYDYEADFADDEEAIPFEQPDEQSKEAQDKIKREQRAANVFDLKEAQDEGRDYDLEQEKEAQRLRDERKQGKRTEKALMNQEKNFLYEGSSDDENPYLSKEEDESENESEADDEAKSAAATADGKAPEASITVEKAPSVASSQGTATPSGRPAKHSEGLLKLSKKRPGSPTASDVSGNESPWKKKKRAHVASGVASQPGSRSMSPATAGGLKPNIGAAQGAARRAVSNQGSDTEFSDNGTRKVKKVRLASAANKTGSGATSPGASRAGSPSAPSSSPKQKAVVQNETFPAASSAEALEILTTEPSGFTLQELAQQLNDKLGRRLGRATLKDIRTRIYFDRHTNRVRLKV